MVSGNVVRRLLDPRHGRVVREVRTALANRHVVPLSRQVSAWRRGFYAETSLIYDFETYGFDDYVSDFARATTLVATNENRYVLDDKVITFLYLRQIGIPTPTVHAFAHHGTVVWLGEHPPEGGLVGLLEQRGRLVVKARSGSGGSGFAVLQRAADTVLANGRALADPADATATGSLILSDFVEQHDDMAAIYPNTTNTMRVMTFRDPDTNEPFVACASHRFGTKRSEPVDNVGAGGLSASIDVRTGRLGRALLQRKSDGRCEPVWLEDHPDTGARISGKEVPHWPEVLAVVLRAAAALPGHGNVSWDLVATPDGCSVIEGNNRGDVTIQMHGPLLVDERMRRIFAKRR